MTPVLSALDSILKQASPVKGIDPESRYVPLSLRMKALKNNIPASDIANLRNEMPSYLKTVARMQRAGVLILAGTDIAADRIPGLSLHRELELLVSAGLTRLQALQTATINPAIMLHLTDQYGTVETGKVADLVLLDRNPLDDISNIRHINAVIEKGQLLDRARLDRILQDIKIQAAHE